MISSTHLSRFDTSCPIFPNSSVVAFRSPISFVVNSSYDADEFGNFLIGKHKEDVSKFIEWKDLNQYGNY